MARLAHCCGRCGNCLPSSWEPVRPDENQPMCPDCAFEEVRADYARRRAAMAKVSITPEVRFTRPDFATVNPAIKPEEIKPAASSFDPVGGSKPVVAAWYDSVASMFLRPARAVMALF